MDRCCSKGNRFLRHLNALVVTLWNQRLSSPFSPCLLLRLFELEPKAKLIFGFTGTNEDMLKNAQFARHARYFIQMIDKALALLGPDIELLTEILMDLGEKHVRYGGLVTVFVLLLAFSFSSTLTKLSIF